MSRRLMRVSMSFDYPLNKVWKGYLAKTLFDPPEGEGFQLRETTSEGSPISPVFKTLDELCEWCEENATVFASIKITKKEWKRMLEGNSVCIKQGNILLG